MPNAPQIPKVVAQVPEATGVYTELAGPVAEHGVRGILLAFHTASRPCFSATPIVARVPLLNSR